LSRYDAIVVGLGTMGTAAAYQLARRGRRVLGIEQFGIVHDRGSMHGETRIIRLAYHEHPDYVPLLRRAYELWRELDPSLLHIVGSLGVGPEDGVVVSGALRACREHGLRYELVQPSAVRVPRGHVAVFQPDGGYLEAERSVHAHAKAARAAGANLLTSEPVLDWSSSSGGVEVITKAGVYEADRLVLCPGAWAAELLHLPPKLFVAERQTVAWFDAPELTAAPVFIVEEDDGSHYYGIAAGGRLKLGRMHADDIELLRDFARSRLPEVGELVESQTCLFTNTPDRHFVLGLHPEAANVAIASACSGHGFKFAPVVGEILADLALEGSTRHEIGFLEPERLLVRKGQ
jgi:sarcosine oxidase